MDALARISEEMVTGACPAGAPVLEMVNVTVTLPPDAKRTPETAARTVTKFTGVGILASVVVGTSACLYCVPDAMYTAGCTVDVVAVPCRGRKENVAV